MALGIGAFFRLDACSDCSGFQSWNENKALGTEEDEGNDPKCRTLDEVLMSGFTDEILEEWQLDDNPLTEEESSFFLHYGRNFSYYDIELFLRSSSARTLMGRIGVVPLTLILEKELIINQFCGDFFPRGGALGSSTTSKKRTEQLVDLIKS